MLIEPIDVMSEPPAPRKKPSYLDALPPAVDISPPPDVQLEPMFALIETDFLLDEFSIYPKQKNLIVYC